MWGEKNRQSAAAYSETVEQAESYATRLRELGELDYLAALKNSKGKLSLKAVNEQLATLTAGEEFEVLSDYVEADKEQKSASKRAKKLLADVEKRFLARLKGDALAESLHELQAVVRYLDLLDKQTGLRAQIREAEAALDVLAYEQYPQLTEAEVKGLVIKDKWLTVLAAAVRSELDRVSQTLTGRIRELAARYETPLPELVDEVEALAAKVNGHLRAMGAEW